MKHDYCLVLWRGDYGEGSPDTYEKGLPRGTKELFRVTDMDTKLNDTEAFKLLIDKAKKMLMV